MLTLAEILASLDGRRKALAVTPAGQAHQIAGLLRSAMDWHGVHGDGDCPVCGRTAAMDEAWRENAEKRIAELDELAGEAREFDAEARRAADRAGRLAAAPPAVLGEGGGGRPRCRAVARPRGMIAASLRRREPRPTIWSRPSGR